MGSHREYDTGETWDEDEGLALTDEERRAIAGLERLAKKWPRSLMIFGASGSLEVRRIPENSEGGGSRFTVAHIIGITADGGDGGDNW